MDVCGLWCRYVGDEMGPKNAAYSRWNCCGGSDTPPHKRHSTLLPPAMRARFTAFWASRPHELAVWLAQLLTKAGDVETNPGPTSTQVWICDVCKKIIHTRKQTSIRCNKTQHWVHLRCAGIQIAQYTDTWTCHLP